MTQALYVAQQAAKINSSAVLTVTGGGTGQSTAGAAFNALDPITSVGDLIIGNGVNSATRLPIGANAYVLTSNGTTAAWAAVPGAVPQSTYTWINKGTVSSGTITFSLNDASTQRVQIGGAVSIATSNWAASGTFQQLIIELVNGGSAAITWPTIYWILPDGTTTTVFASNGVSLQVTGTDWVTLWTRDNGSTIWGKIIR